jgi:hypothetical protein
MYVCANFLATLAEIWLIPCKVKMFKIKSVRAFLSTLRKPYLLLLSSPQITGQLKSDICIQKTTASRKRTFARSKQQGASPSPQQVIYLCNLVCKDASHYHSPQREERLERWRITDFVCKPHARVEYTSCPGVWDERWQLGRSYQDSRDCKTFTASTSIIFLS